MMTCRCVEQHPTYAEYCTNGTCASTQIVRHDRLLSDAHEPKSRKPFAVFVLTHLAGDIHQPLHGADNEDQGGNQIKVRLPDDRKLNLDAVWDTSLVERLYGGQNDITVAKRQTQSMPREPRSGRRARSIW
jgi:hypothetical protein